MSTITVKTLVARIRALFTKGNPMTADISFVSVEMAKTFLKDRNSDNRDGQHVKRNINRLVKAMLNGTFKFSHQAIAFDENGTLIDGHCRLDAMVKIGEKITSFELPFLVIRNAPLNTYNVLDSGKNRTVVDRVREGGRYYTHLAGRAAKRALFGTKSNHVIEDYELLDLVEGHKSKLQLINRILSGRMTSLRNVARGGVLGAVLRFSYTASTAQLIEVLNILATGEASTSSKNNVAAIINFVDYLNEKSLTTGKYLIYGGGQAVENDLYRKAEMALRSYLDNTTIEAGTSTNKELFLFPAPINEQHKTLFGSVYGNSIKFK